ncbi:tripartite tricarboxylate transporter substrate binding protein [Roseomonas sp. SSH11]|uniref:Tripartite tricarboxylate transporter substrate binding protein n=1 Tax=Pararoseomonas baculiformis TaxID=2820812 RepID=A0ABS4AHB0_9PROT|nr:tripartite tricarboxylate transporter substrate binding protein [Pararoseomonas baculiformis]
MNESRGVSRRGALGLAALGLAAPRLARAQGRYPDRPIRFIVPWPPGSSLDALFRSMFDVVRRDLGQQVVLENRPGARGLLGAQALLNARPDGYTIAQHHLSILRQPFLTKQQSWDPVNDFTYILQVSGFLFGVVVRSDSPYRTWRDLTAAAKAKPGMLTFSTSGVATSNHIAMEDILAREGVEMTHVPFRGAQEGVTALLGRQIDCVADAQAWRPNVEAGEFRLLCVWTKDRLPAFPDAPTLRELGHDMVVTSPYGVTGPKGMDPAVVETLHQSFRKGLFDENTQAVMRRWEMPLEYLGPQDYLRFARERVSYEQEMVAKLKLSID